MKLQPCVLPWGTMGSCNRKAIQQQEAELTHMYSLPGNSSDDPEQLKGGLLQLPPLSRGMMRRAKRKQFQQQQAELKRVDSLPWNSSIDSDQLDGGFPMLEEIDEAAYGLTIPVLQLENRNMKEKPAKKSKKRKHDKASDNNGSKEMTKKKYGDEEAQESQDVDDKAAYGLRNKKQKTNPAKKSKKWEQGKTLDSNGSIEMTKKQKSKEDAQRDEDVENNGGSKKTKQAKIESRNKKDAVEEMSTKKKHEDEDQKNEDIDDIGSSEVNGEDIGFNFSKRMNKKKKTTKAKENPKIEDSANDRENRIEECVDEDEYYTWNELRLHPLIMRSIYRLGFKEPTAIQKACIRAAAHQGKDIIAAAETGSGKTLAFGLPILQRLMEEREKAVKMYGENEEKAGRVAPRGLLRALIITPTRELARQVTDHLMEVTKDTDITVVPIIGDMAIEKQERLLKLRPEIVVGTPGRLWALMSGGEKHLVELHSLSFFVLDEADRMIENKHFSELQSIIDMLPVRNTHSEIEQDDVTMPSLQMKKRQTFLVSATLTLSADFRKKLRHISLKRKLSTSDELSSIELLSERVGMRDDVAIINMTSASILANKLVESCIICSEGNKDAYLYYILSVHGQGRTIVFCSSVVATRSVKCLLNILGIKVLTLHSRMRQRARLKAMDDFRQTEHGILVATDAVARGLDILGVRTIIHYQLPHTPEVYVHRCGRTARATDDGCSIALVASNEASKFDSLRRSFSKENFRLFPVDHSYWSEIKTRVSLACQIVKIKQKDSKGKTNKSWCVRHAKEAGVIVDNDEDEDEDDRLINKEQKKASLVFLNKLQQELQMLLSQPLQPKSFSQRYLTMSGTEPLVLNQLEELSKQNLDYSSNSGKKSKLLVIGRNCVEPLQALESSGHERCVRWSVKTAKHVNNLKRKRRKYGKNCLKKHINGGD